MTAPSVGFTGKSRFGHKIRKFVRARKRIATAILLLAGLPGLPGAASAQSSAVESFYKAHSLTIVVGFPAGGGYDVNSRMVGRHIRKYIPGNPNIIVSNMPGAGSLRATGYLANVAAKDGTVFGILNPVNVLEPLIDPARVKFDPRRFNWLGSLAAEFSTCGFWATDVKALADLKRREITVAATGPSSGSSVDTSILKSLLGINFKIVNGYRGMPDMRMAAEKGEVDGMCGLLFSVVKTDSWDAFRSGALVIPLQYGLSKHPDLIDVPNAYDLVSKEEDRDLSELMMGPQALGRAYIAPPGVPADRVQALRSAFKSMLGDPEFLGEAKRLSIEIRPVDPGAMDALVNDMFRTPTAVVERARQFVATER